MLRLQTNNWTDTLVSYFQLKKVKRSTPQDINDDTRAFLASTLAVLLQKMKWDEDEDPDDMDDDDKHAFESLRKVSVF